MSGFSYIKLYRSLLDGNGFNDYTPESFMVWIWCLLKAEYRATVKAPKGREQIELQPGEFTFTYRDACKELPLSLQSIRTCIKSLKSNTRINTQSNTQYTIVSIINWGVYQGVVGLANIQYNKRSNTSLTHAQHTEPVIPFIEEYKKNKESKSTQGESINLEEQKNLYGEEQTVSLTSKQFNCLSRKYGNALQWMIHRLDMYISTLTARKKADYLKRSHYHVLQGWVAGEFLKSHKGHVFPRDDTRGDNQSKVQRSPTNPFWNYMVVEMERNNDKAGDSKIINVD